MSIVVKIEEEDGCGRMQTRPIGYDDGTGHVTGVSEADPLPVSIAGGVTLNGDISASTEYTEDAALPGDPIGGALLARRRDTLTLSEVSADGDAIAVNATAKGELCVSDAAAIAGLASILAKVSADPATQTTLAAVLAKLTSDPATQTTLAAVLAKLTSDPATQTTSAAILAKLTADPATQTTLAAILALLPTALAAHGGLKIEGVASGVAVPVSAASLPLPTGAATEASLAAVSTGVGALTETAPASDTASSGVNGRLQRIAQRLTSLIGLIPAALGANGGFKIEGVASGTAVPVSAASLPLPTGAATEATLAGLSTGVGALTETAPASDTASSGLNGRLQRIAQRLTSLIGLVPTALGANGGFKIEGVASGTAVPVSGPITASQFVSSLQSGTAVHSSVSSGTSSVTILASNSSRKGARIFNTDANNLFLDLSGGTAAAATRAQVKLGQNEGYTVEAGYTGAITGIWAVDGSGVASVVEFT